MASYMMARRRNEIGIRIALGASRRDVIGMAMLEASRLVIMGVLIGTTGALLAGQGARSMLFQLTPYDPPTLLGAAALLAAITFLATFQPARRASKLDPTVALRSE